MGQGGGHASAVVSGCSRPYQLSRWDWTQKTDNGVQNLLLEACPFLCQKTTRHHDNAMSKVTWAKDRKIRGEPLPPVMYKAGSKKTGQILPPHLEKLVTSKLIWSCLFTQDSVTTHSTGFVWDLNGTCTYLASQSTTSWELRFSFFESHGAVFLSIP